MQRATVRAPPGARLLLCAHSVSPGENPSSFDPMGASASPWGFYRYPPSVPAAVVVLVLFLCLTLAVLLQVTRSRHLVHVWLVLGLSIECLGFAARAWSTAHPDHTFAYLAGYLIPIVAPSFLAATCYICFGRIVWATTVADQRRFSTLWVPPRLTTAVFLLVDLVSFCIQLLGIFLVASAYHASTGAIDADQARRGSTALQAGLIVQVIGFGLFTVVGARFLVVSRAWPARTHLPWRKFAWAVNLAATLITVCPPVGGRRDPPS